MSDAVISAEFGEWEVENCRLTIFHSSGSTEPGLWERLMGTSPESIDSRPREGLLREQGGANGNKLLLVTQAQRLDWHLLPDPAPDREIGSPPTLRAVDQMVPILRKGAGCLPAGSPTSA